MKPQIVQLHYDHYLDKRRKKLIEIGDYVKYGRKEAGFDGASISPQDKRTRKSALGGNAEFLSIPKQIKGKLPIVHKGSSLTVGSYLGS